MRRSFILFPLILLHTNCGVPSSSTVFLYLHRSRGALLPVDRRSCAIQPSISLVQPQGYQPEPGHLRAYFEARDDPKALLDAFIKTAYEFKKNEGLMVAYWNVLDEMAAADALPKSLKDYNEFFTRMQLNGFPAVHHSAEYEKAYRPAYRVIAREYFNLA